MTKTFKKNDSEDEFVSRFVEINNKDVILQSEKIAAIMKQEKANIKAVSHIEWLYKEYRSMSNSVITISRQYGSSGHATRVAKILLQP